MSTVSEGLVARVIRHLRTDAPIIGDMLLIWPGREFLPYKQFFRRDVLHLRENEHQCGMATRRVSMHELCIRVLAQKICFTAYPDYRAPARIDPRYAEKKVPLENYCRLFINTVSSEVR